MAKILIVEDEKAIRNVLKNILQDENKAYQISEAEHGKAAIDLLAQEEQDLVLCDIKNKITEKKSLIGNLIKCRVVLLCN